MSQTDLSSNINTGGGAYIGENVNTGGGTFIGRDQNTYTYVLPNNTDLLNWFIEAAERYRTNGNQSLDAAMLKTLKTSVQLLRGQPCDPGVGELDRIRIIMATCIAAKGKDLVGLTGERQTLVIPLLIGQAIWAVFANPVKPANWQAMLESFTSKALIAELQTIYDSNNSWDVERVMANPLHFEACSRLIDDLTDGQRGLPVTKHFLTLRDGQPPETIMDRRTWLIAVVGVGTGGVIGGIAIGIWIANALQSRRLEDGRTSHAVPEQIPAQAQSDVIPVPPPSADQKSSAGEKLYSLTKLYFPPKNTKLPYIVQLADLSPNRNLPSIIAQMEFCFVPEGNFLMGELQNDPDAWETDKPQHTVYISSFYMARYPVTVEQFAVFVEMVQYRTIAENENSEWTWCTPRSKGSDLRSKHHHPVTQVAAKDIDRFAEWLADLAQLPIRHPTEAEWEKAARGTDGRKYPWGPQAPTAQLCNFNNHKKDTTPVGEYSRWGDSPYGCADMVGNVWERCADTYHSNLYKDRANIVIHDPSHFASGERRVLRGGAFFSGALNVRCAGRGGYWGSGPLITVGVRLAVSPISLHPSGR